MPKQIAIVDYGMGNLNSVKKKLLRLGVEPIISPEPADITSADKLILPGVGHFQKAMENLRQLGLIEALNEAVHSRQIPILGICLGMQLMTRRSEEGDVSGLGWFDAEVVKFRVHDKVKYKVPHMGWNQTLVKNESLLTEGLPELSEFYFVHSYHVKADDPEDILSVTEYEYRFPSAIGKGHIFGVQYHPEKSHDVGEALLRNFVEI